jgi:hypothetical protein
MEIIIGGRGGLIFVARFVCTSLASLVPAMCPFVGAAINVAPCHYL